MVGEASAGEGTDGRKSRVEEVVPELGGDAGDADFLTSVHAITLRLTSKMTVAKYARPLPENCPNTAIMETWSMRQRLPLVLKRPE